LKERRYKEAASAAINKKSEKIIKEIREKGKKYHTHPLYL
jgi:hypothetical protein